MAKTYTVWVCVEEYDDKTDNYRDVDLPFASVAESRSCNKAEALAETLTHIGRVISGERLEGESKSEP